MKNGQKTILMAVKKNFARNHDHNNAIFSNLLDEILQNFVPGRKDLNWHVLESHNLENVLILRKILAYIFKAMDMR